MHEIYIHAIWDDEAKVYVATSDDLPGLVAEGETLEALDVKLAILVPELVELNAHLFSEGTLTAGGIPVQITAQKREIIAIAS